MKSNFKNYRRDLAVDMMKGILILLVIIGHVTQIPEQVRHVIYSFHMPAFFMIAGFFQKPMLQMAVLKNGWHRLIVPFLFSWSMLLVYSIAVMVVRQRFHNDIFLGFLYPASAHVQAPTLVVWFLLALFFCRLICNIVWNLRIRYWYKFCIVISVSIGAIYLGGLIDLPFAFLQGCSAVVFMVIGKMMYSYIKRYGIRWTFVVLCGGLWAFSVFYGRVDMASFHYKYYLLVVFGAMGATYLLYCMCKSIEGVVPLLSSIFAWLGQYSLIMMCVHSIERYIPIWSQLHLDNIYCLISAKIAFCILVTSWTINTTIGKKVFYTNEYQKYNP